MLENWNKGESICLLSKLDLELDAPDCCFNKKPTAYVVKFVNETRKKTNDKSQ